MYTYLILIYTNNVKIYSIIMTLWSITYGILDRNLQLISIKVVQTYSMHEHQL